MSETRADLLRNAVGGAVLWMGVWAAILFLAASSLRSQDPVPVPTGTQPPVAQPPAEEQKAEEQEPAGQKPGEAQPGEAQPGEAQPGEALARIVPAEVKPRCFSTDISPTYDETLAEGTVVAVGGTYAGYRKVLLPLGPLGFVHKKYTTEPEEGLVKSVGSGVSFRYRPRAQEAPVEMLDDGALLHIVGEEGDWWRVRHPGGPAWLAETELQIFPDANETLRKSYAELAKVHGAAVTAWARERANAAERARLLDEKAAGLAALNERFQEELQKPVGEQDYTAVEAELGVFAGDLPEGSALAANAEILEKNIARQKWVVEAIRIRDEKPVPVAAGERTPVAPREEDPLGRKFAAIGWLRRQAFFRSESRYYIEKGGKMLYWVTCTSRRYDLGLFLDKEVGLEGPKQRPTSDSIRVVDVEKIEILGVR